MGEFHAAVSTLLDAFARGISIIKAQRKQRKRGKGGHIPFDQSSKVAEIHLSKSLKKNRTEVETAYGKDLSRFGPGFAKGDAEAHSSLSAILFRLNAGFVSVIERFTKGRSSPTDYQVLLNLSNASRLEAISTFQELSYRLSRSSLALVPSSPHRSSHQKTSTTRRRKKKSTTSSSKHTHARSKSAPELSISITPLGPATPEGWVRPKAGRKLSTDSRSSGSSTPKQRNPKPLALPAPAPAPAPRLPPATRRSPPPPPYQSQLPSPVSPASAVQTQNLPSARSRADKRKSIMSFASDSTKLGEIPEHKWARNAIVEGAEFPIRPYYPVQPYEEPEKPRSRLARLFRR